MQKPFLMKIARTCVECPVGGQPRNLPGRPPRTRSRSDRSPFRSATFTGVGREQLPGHFASSQVSIGPKGEGTHFFFRPLTMVPSGITPLARGWVTLAPVGLTVETGAEPMVVTRPAVLAAFETLEAGFSSRATNLEGSFSRTSMSFPSALIITF